MTNVMLKTIQRTATATALIVAVAACSTAPGQSQAASSEGDIRSWADWATIPGGIPSDQKPISNLGDAGN